MKAITLRNIPPELQRCLEKEATGSNTSLNKTVLRLLLKATGLEPLPERQRRFHDLDHLAGTWTREEAAAFEKSLQAQRRIDPEIWE
jgi:hypothetical protein